MHAERPRPGVRHVLLKSRGCEPHWEREQQAPGQPGDRLERGIVQRVQHQEHQCAVGYRRTTQRRQGLSQQNCSQERSQELLGARDSSCL